ncbi:MAG: NAD(P)-dependent oxidoreductase [Ruminococcus flavefaciens]|nr:NAD(P)-dependent oxidoreductase [Ruminococcus flavefaciens]MCM1230525.1 NAD(P)-dependent oxidoreductase [Ruminococcus flavefaciens]
MKKIAITGAGGFLGTALMNRLVVRTDVLVYAFSFDFERSRETFVRGENIIPVDNSEVGSFDFSDIDVVINCAFPRNAASDIIADGLDFMAEVLRKSAVSGAVINISSQSVYNTHRTEPAKETDKCCLETKYAVGKYASELMNNTLCGNIPHTNIRMASLIGPKFDQRVTNKLVETALKTGKLTVNDDNQFFGYLDIEDAVSGILSLLEIPAENWKSVYNLGDSATYSLKMIAETIAEVVYEECGKTVEISLQPADLTLNSALDGSLLEADTGFRPSVAFKQSIQRIVYEKLQKNC